MKLVEVGTVCLHYRKACMKLVEVWIVRFVYLTADRKLVEVGRVCLTTAKHVWEAKMFGESIFSYLKVDMRLVDVGSVRFEYPKAYMRLLEVWRVWFEYRKVCRKFVEFLTVHFDYLIADMKLVEAGWIGKHEYFWYKFNVIGCLATSKSATIVGLQQCSYGREAGWKFCSAQISFMCASVNDIFNKLHCLNTMSSPTQNFSIWP